MLDARIKKVFGSGNGHSFALDVEFTASDGITVLFGASGAGKTSILRAVAGILRPDEGRISLDAKTYFDSASGICLPMQKRKIGYVFQHHVLFPHMTAEQNVMYGASALSRHAAQERVRELFYLLAIEKTAVRYPHELSGGEQQRIALARALATDPMLMLLDEPLSAVDVVTRLRLLEEMAAIQQRSKIPFLYVTHNHSEAVRLGTKMLVIDEGKILQEGTPLEIFNAPQTAPVARLVGAENVFAGKILHHHPEDGMTSIDIGACLLEVSYNALPVDTAVTIGLRSEDILVSRERLGQTSARNVLRGSVRRIITEVDATELVVDCGVDVKVSVTRAAVRQLGLEVGSEVYLLIKARALHVIA
jgi:molybdate transport system ATP-binding protein